MAKKRKNEYIFHDDYMEIVIYSETYGIHSVLVDVEDFELVSRHRWCLKKDVSRTSGDISFYAIANVRKENGCNVISGLAYGCDTKAHEGCLAARGRTVAVLAHGLDTVYPSKNRILAEVIVKTNGCLVSEYPPGVRAAKRYFMERNRIQSGLSDGVVVVEAETRSGTMNTTRAARKQNRPLACVVHPLHTLAGGNQRLLSQGAFPLTDADSVEKYMQKLKGRVEGAQQ